MYLASLRAMALGAVLNLVAGPLAALGLIRDPDIEYALEQLARPVLQAAGLPAGQIKIIIVDDRRPNAFVADGSAIFIHYGLILQLETAAQLQAVIAHEAAHIAGGHITQRALALRASRNAVGFGILAAALAAAYGGGEAAAGIAAGTAGSATRVLFAHTRAQEASADQASIRYLIAAGIDPKAAVEVTEIFLGQEALSVGRQDPYMRTHPLTRDRFRTLSGLVAANPGNPGDSSAADYWFARAQGKLSAFTQSPQWTLRQVRGKTDLVSTLRRAVALHRRPDPAAAISTMQALTAAQPGDPFLWELYGQILLENRNAEAAVAAYGRAAELAPGNALILGGLGRALLAQDTGPSNARALDVLERARARDPLDARILRDLGLAYARAGRTGEASLATAERYALTGRFEDAVLHATRARDLLPRGSAAWQRAMDVLSAAETAIPRR